MPDDTTHPQDARGGTAAPGGATRAAGTLKPADSELRFSHLIRNMIVARDEAKEGR